jgi:hypothetical protein
MVYFFIGIKFLFIFKHFRLFYLIRCMVMGKYNERVENAFKKLIYCFFICMYLFVE